MSRTRPGQVARGVCEPIPDLQENVTFFTVLVDIQSLQLAGLADSQTDRCVQNLLAGITVPTTANPIRQLNPDDLRPPSAGHYRTAVPPSAASPVTAGVANTPVSNAPTVPPTP